jgi:hypothetical protein
VGLASRGSGAGGLVDTEFIAHGLPTLSQNASHCDGAMDGGLAILVPHTQTSFGVTSTSGLTVVCVFLIDMFSSPFVYLSHGIGASVTLTLRDVALLLAS